jgi:hypothetical protein
MFRNSSDATVERMPAPASASDKKYNNKQLVSK